MKKIKFSRSLPCDDTWDVIVVGGGPAGCAAAAAAGREGAKTLLIEATGSLGGMGTNGLIPAWCPFSDGKDMLYRGIGERVFNECKTGIFCHIGIESPIAISLKLNAICAAAMPTAKSRM